jgi:hypothetical protein
MVLVAVKTAASSPAFGGRRRVSSGEKWSAGERTFGIVGSLEAVIVGSLRETGSARAAARGVEKI